MQNFLSASGHGGDKLLCRNHYLLHGPAQLLYSYKQTRSVDRGTPGRNPPSFHTVPASSVGRHRNRRGPLQYHGTAELRSPLMLDLSAKRPQTDPVALSPSNLQLAWRNLESRPGKPPIENDATHLRIQPHEYGHVRQDVGDFS